MSVEPISQNISQNADGGSPAFGNLPNANSESGGKFSRPTQRKDSHTISVRDAAKMFEAAGVARTERSIINWCWPNRQGLARLDSYFDPNDRKYFITQQSIELAIKEELSKSQPQESTAFPNGQEKVPQPSENPQSASAQDSTAPANEVAELEKQIFDLSITNRAKDMFIERLQDERKAFADERQTYIDQLVSNSRQLGELKIRLFQLEGPRDELWQSGDSVGQPESTVG
jgi:hypothetical protein